jgi:hypothetical protein
MHRYIVILAAALFACSGDKDTADDTGVVGDDDDDDDACTNLVTGQFPEQGSTDVFVETDVRFTLTENDPTATITVTDPAGTAVPGTTVVADTLVTWSSDERLQPVTQYTATLDYSCEPATVTWTTNEIGGETTVDLVGQVYGLDVASGEWVQPPGVGDLIASQLGATQIFLSVTNVTETNIEMLGAIGSNAAQDVCTPTIPFPPAAWEDPFFSLEDDLLPLDVSGFVINIEDLQLSGGFAPDGSRIGGGSLKGAVDTRPLGEAFGLGTGENAVCELVATFGVACDECSDGSGPYCLSVWVDNIAALNLPTTTVVTVTEDDIAANPDCN